MARGGCGVAAATHVYRASDIFQCKGIKMHNLRIHATSAQSTMAPEKTVFFVPGVNCALPVDRIICSHACGSTGAVQHHHHFATNGLILSSQMAPSSSSNPFIGNQTRLSPPRGPDQNVERCERRPKEICRVNCKGST